MRRGRPPKAPADRHNESMKIPLTAKEKREIQAAAHRADERPITWARAVLLKACKRSKH
jgi:hypothetical protein